MCVAAVVVTPASGTCLNNTPGAFSTIGNITIQEGTMSDFANESGVTFILSAPAGFEFLAGTGAVSYTASRNFTAAAIVVTSSTITVTYSTNGINKSDRLVISSIQVRGLVAGSAGNILRTGGTATITGDATGGGVNHGSLSSSGTGVTVSSIANGNWSWPGTWSTGTVPTCGQNISISHTVTADVASSIANLTISTGGNLVTSNSVSVSGSFTITGTGTYTHNNIGDASTTIFAGTESFASTSTLIFNQWYNLNIPLASLTSGNFGNITFNVTGAWQQDGYFAPAKIQGNVIINSGTLVLDDGTGMSTAITLKDITINGDGNLTACSGASRNFAFTTGNFTDNGIGGTLTSIMNACTGILSWTANGNVTLNDNFRLITASGSPASVSMNVTGNLDITGGSVDFLESTNSPFTLTVTGRTGISGSPGYVSLVNSGSGAMSFTSGSLEVTAYTTIQLLTGSFSGTNQFNIINDLVVNGATTILYLVNNLGYTPTINLTTGRDILITNGDLFVSNSNGPVTINCGRHLTIAGTASEFDGQSNLSNIQLVDITVSGTMSITGATFYHTKGEGNVILTIGEAFAIDNGNFYGINHAASPGSATATFTFQDFIFQGGSARFFTLKTASPTLVTVNCTNNFNITWESNTDVVELVSYDGNNDASLDFNVGGNFTIIGNYPSAYFLSSKAGGNEIVNIAGSLYVSGGMVFFVCDNTSTNGVDAHSIVITIGTNIDIYGGTVFLSTRDGAATVTVDGDVYISGGILNLKWLSGAATLTVNGGFYQTGGTYNMHSHTAGNSDTCKVIVNGDFSQTAGTFNFDNATGASADHTLTINGSDYEVGGTGVITHANNLTTGTVFGQIYFNRTGTTVYSRSSSTHNVQHVKQTISSRTTLNASSSANGFQMTSISSNNVVTHNVLTVLGTLDMGNKILTSRQNANYYARLTVDAGGRYRTSHTGGLYSGSSSVASSIDGYISGLNRTSFLLATTSTVEYYGTSSSIVTGVPNGIANSASQQYGILEINFTGTAGSTWVYPETSDEVHIRTSLVMTAGEFNLDNDHVTTNGGRPINLEAGATTSRTGGFVRSETIDGSAVVKWNITTNSSNTFPFGYDASNYIPFTFQQTSGSSGIVQIGTYRTVPANTPFPPTVTHVRDVNGINNSAFTVDRFWNITVPGTANAALTFSYTTSEGSGIISPRAQRWEPVTSGWYPPSGTQSNPTASTTLASGISAFGTWWTLSSLASPLPIELVDFEVEKSGSNVSISWITQTEINNDYFTVERSADGMQFEPIKVVDGAGNSTSALNYNVIDYSPAAGRNYYRLKQNDFDGNFTYSETKSIFFGKTGNYSMYPNPATSNSELTIEVPENGKYSVRIMDAVGRLVYENEFNTSDGSAIQIGHALPSMSEGFYGVIITGTHTSFSQKLILRK